jgi:L-fucose mutarotase
LRADGLRIHDLLDAIMPLWALDPYVEDPIVMMAVGEGDAPDPRVAARYRAAIERHAPEATATTFISRFAFYERTRKAFAVVLTGETAKYGNILIKKGVIPVL